MLGSSTTWRGLLMQCRSSRRSWKQQDDVRGKEDCQARVEHRAGGSLPFTVALLPLTPPLLHQAWHTMAPLVQSGKDNALRAKASVDRVVRLAAEYSDALMKVYAQPAAELGRGLSVPPYMASVFAGGW